MELRRLLRQLVVAEVVLIVVLVIVEFIAERFLPRPLREWTDAQWDDDLAPVEVLTLVIALPLLVGLVVSWVGLWRLWRPARRIYLLVLIGGALLQVIMGPVVMSGPGAALSTLQSAVSGLIIALIYLTPLSAAFDHAPAAPPCGGFEVNMPAPIPERADEPAAQHE